MTAPALSQQWIDAGFPVQRLTEDNFIVDVSDDGSGFADLRFHYWRPGDAGMLSLTVNGDTEPALVWRGSFALVSEDFDEVRRHVRRLLTAAFDGAPESVGLHAIIEEQS